MAVKKALVIFNPTAGLNTKKNVEKLVRENLKSLGYQVNLFYLNKKFEDNIANYNFKDIKLAVAVGGDGTVKVAARTILENKLNIPLAIIPFGSSNVIAVTLGIPILVKKALNMLKGKTKIIKIDVGLINKQHYFLVGFSIGYISKVVINTSRQLKDKFGFFSYLFRFIFNKIKIRKIKFTIKSGRNEHIVYGNSLVIFNVVNYFGFKPKRPVDFADGILDLFVFTSKTFISLLQALFYVLVYYQPPKYVFSLSDNNFIIKFNKGVRTCQVDGDYINIDRELQIKVLPKALKIIAKDV